METPRLQAAYRIIASRLVSALKASVPVRTGRLRDSIRAEVNDQGVVTDIMVEGESYFKYVMPQGNKGPRARGGVAASSSPMTTKAGMSPVLSMVEKQNEDIFDGNTLADALQEDGLAEIERIMNELFD